MRVHELIDYLMNFDNDDEIEIEIYETSSEKCIDTTAAISLSATATVPTLQADIEAGKFLV